MTLDAKTTIVAIATSYGVGSIAIVRVSGDRALSIASQMTKGFLQPRYAHLKKLYDDQDIIDQAIVIYFKAPHSFTGEDIVEFQCHGGLVVANAIVQTCLKLGAVMAGQGEFSKRAFVNGKATLGELETISALIHTQDTHSAKLIAKNLSGGLHDFVQGLRQELIEALAFSEVSIDYAGEDLPPDLMMQLEDRLCKLMQKASQSIAISQRRLGAMQGHRVVLVGQPNVGKSSVLNALLGDDRAIVSAKSGTTRDAIEEQLQLGTHLVKVIDTAGIHDGQCDLERIGIQKSFDRLQEADVIVVLLDGTTLLDDRDQVILDYVKTHAPKTKTLKVLTKSDLPIHATKQSLSPITISAKQNDLTDLIQALHDHLDADSSYDGAMLTSSRQIQSLQKSIDAINESLGFLHLEQLEFFSFHIQEAIEALNEITKSYEHSELLDSLFGNFCLGK